ncbi:MAG: hypothetical protein WC761_01895 [Candidatus Paceibacterota bacterium]|jgi:hypothetical protein
MMKKLEQNTLMLRQAGKLGHFKSTNRPVAFSKGTLYEVVRIVDKGHSYINVNGNTYLAKNSDLDLKETPKKQVVKTIKEQAPEAPPQQMSDFQAPPQKPVSLDQVVDRYIVRYERESIPLTGEPGPGPSPGSQPAGGSPSTMEEGANLKGLMNFLFEQAPPPPLEDEPPAEDDPAALGGDTTADPGGGLDMGDEGGDAGGAPPPNAPPVVNTPKINLNDFSRSVARMVNNFDALLNPKTIILNRVEAYLKSNYDERTAKHFMQIMERNYGLNVTSVEYPEDNNDFPSPVAGTAVMSAGG